MRIDRREFIVTLGPTTLAACGDKGTGSPPATAGSGGGGGAAAGGPPVTLDFRGLIAVVRPSTSSDPLNVLLVDGTGTIGQQHDPKLAIEKAKVASPASGTLPDMIVNGKNYMMFDLKGAELTFNSTTSGISLISNHRAAGHQKPDPGEEDDISWMPEMSKIPGVGTGKINPACLATDPRTAYVAARVRITGGQLRSRFDNIWKDRIFQFKNGPSTYVQALGMGQISVPCSQPATLKIAKFDGSSTVTITLTPGAQDAVVYNEPAALPATCNPTDDFNHLQHFAAFYKLVDPATPPTATPIPECTSANCPVCPSNKQIGHQSDFIYCPPAQF